MSVENVVKSIEMMDEDNLIKWMSNIIFGDINRIKVFNPDEMYYVDDIVYISGEYTGEEGPYFYLCNRHGVTGQYQSRDWRRFVLSQPDKRSFLESIRYTAPADSTSQVPITRNISLDKHELILTHSVKGRLKKGVDWSFKDRNTINLTSSLFEGEWVDIDYYE